MYLCAGNDANTKTNIMTFTANNQEFTIEAFNNGATGTAYLYTTDGTCIGSIAYDSTLTSEFKISDAFDYLTKYAQA